jgi:hypothetical protein
VSEGRSRADDGVSISLWRSVKDGVLMGWRHLPADKIDQDRSTTQQVPREHATATWNGVQLTYRRRRHTTKHSLQPYSLPLAHPLALWTASLLKVNLSS